MWLQNPSQQASEKEWFSGQLFLLVHQLRIGSRALCWSGHNERRLFRSCGLISPLIEASNPHISPRNPWCKMVELSVPWIRSKPKRLENWGRNFNLFKSLPFEMTADKAKDRQKERFRWINAVQPSTDSLVTIEHWDKKQKNVDRSGRTEWGMETLMLH